MSSRSGPRASGSDGSDFSHREQVASHYKDSVKWKSKLKLNLTLHLILIFLGILWTALGYFKMIEYHIQDWQMAWLCTVIPVIFGLTSLPKNKHNQMYIYVIGSMGLGFGPMVYGASTYVRTVLDNLQKDNSFDMRGLSIKLAVLALIVQMQITGIYYAVKLINAWKAKGEKKTS